MNSWVFSSMFCHSPANPGLQEETEIKDGKSFG